MRRPAVLRFGDLIADIELEDLTREGCRIAYAAELPPFAAITIGIAGVGQTCGRLVWRSATSYGCVFDVRLAPGAVTAAALNNVALLRAGAKETKIVKSEDVKYSLRQCIVIAAVSNVLLWSAVAAAVALLT